MTRKCHVRFGSGGGVGDRPAHHNLAGHLLCKNISICSMHSSTFANELHNFSGRNTQVYAFNI